MAVVSLWALRADKPDPLSNCSVSHQSSESLQIACSEGFSGGLPQNFLLEIFEATTAAAAAAAAATARPTPPEIKTNQTSMKPVFIVRGLSADTAYLAHVTAVNAKGRSEPLVVRIVTLRLPETQNNIGSGKSEGQSVFPLSRWAAHAMTPSEKENVDISVLYGPRGIGSIFCLKVSTFSG